MKRPAPGFRFSAMIFLFFWSDILFGQYPSAVPVSARYEAGFRSISETDSRRWLKHLVSDEFAGRGTGQPGYVLAADWFAGQLQELGFSPGGVDGSWFQPVPFVRQTVVRESTRLKRGDQELVSGDSFGISRFTGVVDQQLSLTFLDLVREMPSASENLFRGRLLVMMVRAGRIDPADPFFSRAAPAGVLIVTDDAAVRSEAVQRIEETPVPYPCLTICRSAATQLASESGIETPMFTPQAPTGDEIHESPDRIQCQLQIDREPVDVPNVLGWYRGAEADACPEYVTVGAHLDHLGIQQGKIYPGADDNASGSTALLQVAKAIAETPERPKRSILLMAFCAEERGLLGSKYWCEHPTRPIGNMVCMMNIDMIGRNEENQSESAADNENTIHLVGCREKFPGLHDLYSAANRNVGFVFEYDEERVNLRSDHASFAAKGIPSAFLFGGFNPHYHQTTDTLDGINYQKIANAARLKYLTVMMAADQGLPELPESEGGSAKP